MPTDSGSYDQATLARRYAMAQKLMERGNEPVKHWAQGLSNLANSALGGYEYSKIDEERKAEKVKETSDLYGALGLTPPPAAPVEPTGGFQKLAALLSGGGSSAPATAPVAPGGDQASYPTPPAAAPPPTTFRPGIAAPAAAPPDAALPRGLRNNNPLNIEAGDFTKGQPGFVGSDGRFARFETPEQGTAAASKLLDTYESKYGLNTPAGIIGRWAPQGENNSAAYAATVAKKLGIGPNDPITPEMRPQLIAAMSEVENGRPAAVPQAAPPSAAPQIASALGAPTGDATLPPGATPAQGALPTAEQAAGGSGILANVPPDKKRQIATMLSSTNPTVKALGTSMIQQLTKPETTDEIKEYNLAKSQGFAGSFVDFKTALKKAGATNVVTNVEKGENSFATEAGKSQAKRFDELAGEGQKAKQMVADIDTLTELGKSIGTGKGAEVLSKIGPWAESIGVPVKGLSEIQAFEAIANRVAPSLRIPGSGAQSDFELKNFLKSIPALGNTPEGNAIAAATMKGLQENKVRAAEIGSKALNGEITRPEAEKMLRELPDPMEGYRAYEKANKETKAETKSAPKGVDPGALEEARRRGLIK